MNAIQAKFIADAVRDESKSDEDTALDEIQTLIKEASQKGDYAVRYNGFLNDSVKQELRRLGFEIDTTNAEHIGIKIKWKSC